MLALQDDLSATCVEAARIVCVKSLAIWLQETSLCVLGLIQKAGCIPSNEVRTDGQMIRPIQTPTGKGSRRVLVLIFTG